jgi:hypothetical protein
VTISQVGSLAFGSGSATLAGITTVELGDVLVLFYGDQNSPTPQTLTSVTCSLVSGGWNVCPGTGAGNYTGAIAWGIVTSVGTSTLTVVSSAATYAQTLLGTFEFNSSIPGSWAQDGLFGTVGNTSGASSGTYASLTPSGANELYAAQLTTHLTPSGSTAGFTYVNGWETNSNIAASLVYNLSASSPTTQSPAWGSSATNYSTSSVLLKFIPASLPAPVIKLQAVRRAATYFRRQSGLWAPERGFVLPRVA